MKSNTCAVKGRIIVLWRKIPTNVHCFENGCELEIWPQKTFLLICPCLYYNAEINEQSNDYIKMRNSNLLSVIENYIYINAFKEHQFIRLR